MAEALTRVAQSLEWDCTRVVSREEERDLPPAGVPVVAIDALGSYLSGLSAAGRSLEAVVVASQGHYDELILEALLPIKPAYVGLVASRKRGALVRDMLRDRGAGNDFVAAVHNPAGLDIGATTPGEVAVSIMAEIVQCRQTQAVCEAVSTAPAAAATTATDPVCSMEVEIVTAMHRADHADSTYYFCCLHCKMSFEKNPTRYLVSAGAT